MVRANEWEKVRITVQGWSKYIGFMDEQVFNLF